MKSLVVAAGLLALGASTASAQYGGGYHRDHHPYAQRHHSVCQDKAIRLHGYVVRSKRDDGRLDRRERETIRSLERDLDRTCGRYRHRG